MNPKPGCTTKHLLEDDFECAIEGLTIPVDPSCKDAVLSIAKYTNQNISLTDKQVPTLPKSEGAGSSLVLSPQLVLDYEVKTG
jgi:hypothetical protein